MMIHQSGKVISQQKNTVRLKEVLTSFTENDLLIVCRDGHTTYTSTLLFVISSGYIRSILTDIFENRSRLDDEPVTMCLPDFDVCSVEGVIKVCSNGK